MRIVPDPLVTIWLDRQASESLFLTTISLAELRHGIAVLPAGRRRDDLAIMLDDILPLFATRLLAFDREAAEAYATLRAQAKMQGKAVAPADGYIAAIAAARGFAVATRDTAPFEAAGIRVIDPWASGAP